MIVIPAVDLRGGRCVRLYQGDFEQQTDYGKPVGIARRHIESGATWLHVVDLDGARDGSQANEDVVRDILDKTPMQLQLGGGIRRRDDVARWLDTGVARCVIGSMAVTDAEEVRRWIAEFGPDAIVLALDVRIDADGRPLLTTHGWRETSDIALDDGIEGFLDVGLRHVLCTDVSKDGAMTGPNVTLYEELVARFPQIDLQASGGVRGIDDLQQLRSSGAAAAVCGRALLDGSLSHAEVKSFLLDA